MAQAYVGQKRIRRYFGKIREVLDMPNLIDESLDGVGRVKKIVDNLRDFSQVDSADWQYASLEKGLESTLNVLWNEIKDKAKIVRQFECLQSFSKKVTFSCRSI